MSKLLITADWHIRSTVPSCIEATPEEWMDFQKKSVHRVLEIAKENNVDEIDVGGDLYHSERTSTNECTYLLQGMQLRDENGAPISNDYTIDKEGNYKYLYIEEPICDKESSSTFLQLFATTIYMYELSSNPGVG